MLILVA